MKYSRERQRRQSLRLPNYDYASSGAYFITLCTHERRYLFGEIMGGQMQLIPLGRIAQEEWVRSTQIRREVLLDAAVIMPNHVHGIVVIDAAIIGGAVGATGRSPLQAGRSLQETPRVVRPGPPARSLPAFVAGFKSATTRRINEARALCTRLPVWQRNYYEHIIRNPGELHRIREYIVQNPARWPEDLENPSAQRLVTPAPWEPGRDRRNEGAPGL